jgi:NADH-quinone oxidoreductase subunit N
MRSPNQSRRGRRIDAGMNTSLASLEIMVVLIGLGLLVVDLWVSDLRRMLGYVAATALGFVLVFSFSSLAAPDAGGTAFHGLFIQDGFALFFKRLFLVAAILVLVLAVEFADRLPAALAEYYSLIVFALAGMMFAASANDLSLLFVAVELITVTFYVLVSFQRSRLASLEAGVKYLILGALSSALMVFGIALVSGTSGTMNFAELAAAAPRLADNRLFLVGLLLLLAGLGFKIAVVPMQLWAPDVYEGSPTPTTAFLAIGSKAAGFALLLRLLFTAVPSITEQWSRLWIGLAAATILYGNLCAIPQRNVKRLLGYSSIAHAGYLLIGVACLSASGQTAVLFYLGGYLFTVLAAFAVIAIALRRAEAEDVSGLAGLSQRSPFLAAALTIALASLAGVPPLVGFFGKFLLLKAAVEQGASDPAYYGLAAVALVGVVISLYYYFGVVRAMYWSPAADGAQPLTFSQPIRWVLRVCVAGMLGLGLFPDVLMNRLAPIVAALNP